MSLLPLLTVWYRSCAVPRSRAVSLCWPLSVSTLKTGSLSPPHNAQGSTATLAGTSVSMTTRLQFLSLAESGRHIQWDGPTGEGTKTRLGVFQMKVDKWISCWLTQHGPSSVSRAWKTYTHWSWEHTQWMDCNTPTSIPCSSTSHAPLMTLLILFYFFMPQFVFSWKKQGPMYEDWHLLLYWALIIASW